MPRPQLKIETAIDLLIRLRWILMLVVLSITAYFGAQLPNLVLDGSMERIMLKDDPERDVWQRSTDLFGSDELVTVAIPYPESVWNDNALQRLGEVTATVQDVEGVTQVSSLTNTLVVRRMIIPRTKTILEWLESGVAIEELRVAALSDPTVRKNLVSDDGHHAALTIRLSPRAVTTVGLKKQIVNDLRTQLNAELGPGNYHITGWPVIHVEIAQYMLRDLSVLVPLVACVIAILLALTFRRVAGVLLPLTTIGVVQIWTIGGLVATGHSISMVTNSLPVIIVAIGTTFCVHVVSQIFRAHQSETDKTAAIRLALQRTAPSILLSGLTTMVGFAALKLSPVDSIDEFGTFAVWGIGVGAFLSLTLLPCLALIFPLRAVQTNPRPRFQIAPKAFVQAVLSRRRIIWIVTGGVVLLSAYGLSRIQVETAPVSWFPEDSETRRSVNYVNDNLAGMTPFNVVLEFEEADTAAQLETLQRIDDLQRWLLEQPEVDTTLSVVDPLKVVYRSTRGGRKLVIPQDQRRVDKVMRIVRSGSIAGIDALINEQASAANIIIRSPEVSTKKSIAFTDRVNARLAETFPDAKLARVTGSAYLAYRTNKHFTSGLAFSLSIGMAIICLIMVLLFGSLKLGLLAMVPNVLPVVVNYAILGLFNMNLNSATSITGCIAIGIAVDDTIHFLMAFRQGLKLGHNVPEAIEHGLGEVGRPMLVTTLVLSVGFSVLLMSSFSPVVSLGILVALAMIACLLCDTLFLPVLLTTKIPSWRAVRESKQAPALRDGVPDETAVPEALS